MILLFNLNMERKENIISTCFGTIFGTGITYSVYRLAKAPPGLRTLCIALGYNVISMYGLTKLNKYNTPEIWSLEKN